MNRDEQLAWLQLQADCGCPTDSCEHTDAEPPDATTAAAMRIVAEHGWWYDPPLGPDTVLKMVELAQLPRWHVRDDTGRVWKLRARGAGIEGRENRLVPVDETGD